MAKTEIYFFGLVAHVGDLHASNHAVVVLALNPHHPHSGHVYCDYDTSVTRLATGDDVTLGATSGSQKRSSNFDKWVPSLQFLSTAGAAVKNGVAQHNSHVDSRAFVYYPAGNSGLDVADLYVSGGHFTRSDGFTHDQCVARLTVIQLNTEETLRVSIGSSTIKHVPSSSWLMVANIGKNTSGHAHNHFEEYRHLTTAQELALPTPITRDCKLTNKELVHLEAAKKYIESLRPFTADEIECANSKWP